MQDSSNFEIFLRGSVKYVDALMVYLPAEKAIIEADVFTANAQGDPCSAHRSRPTLRPISHGAYDACNFPDNILRLNLAVRTLLPIRPTRG